MIIQTKFNVSDIVYFIWNNQVCNAFITSINIQVTKTHSIKIRYTVSYKDLTASLCEESLFLTKKELIKSL